MHHLVSKLGGLLHLHPLAYLLEARKASGVPGGRDPGNDPAHAIGTDDLSILGLRGEHHASDSPSSLGRFALLAGDDAEHRARIESAWDRVD